jgi:hypothetical protein
MDWEPPSVRYVNTSIYKLSRHHYLRYHETYLDQQLDRDDDLLKGTTMSIYLILKELIFTLHLLRELA